MDGANDICQQYSGYFCFTKGWKEQLTRLQMDYRDSQKSAGTAGTFE
jgi:hypothetical protein